MMEKLFHRPKIRKWYARWWGIVALIMLGLFLSVSVASGIFVFMVSKRLKSGNSSPQDFIGKRYTESHAERLYGINPPVAGPEGAPLAMVVFISYTSLEAKQAIEAINAIMLDAYYKNKVKFIFRHFPNIDNPFSIAAALAIECAHEQGNFIAMQNAVIQEPDLSQVSLYSLAGKSGLDAIEFKSCFDSQLHLERIQRDVSDAVSLGVKVSPTFIIYDKIVGGTPTAQDIKKAIDLLLIKK